MKLYTLHGIKFYDDDKITAKPATPAEVAEAHPNCRTCEHIKCPAYDNDLYLHDFYCTQHQMPIEDPALDYCRHHSELTKENDDDRPE